MGKSLYIAEKPSVAQEFAKALHINTQRKDGYLESAEAIVTWCVGHLVTMSYPEEYDPALKRWSLETLPFIPQEFKYEVIPAVSKQFRIVSGLLNRTDVDTIYVCTDSGREGEYIYRLVEQQAGVKGKNRRRVWIDSQTEEEILRAVNLCIQAEADYVKTSTGWYPSHPSALSHIQLMSDAAKGRIKIKAAGGIRTLETIRAMEKAGCDRFGISISSALKLFHDLY